MKIIKHLVLIVIAILLVFTLANLLFFPLKASDIIQFSNSSGRITDQAETKGSTLVLVNEIDSDNMKLLHYQKSPLFQRYRLVEVISFISDSPKHYGFRDFFNSFSVEVTSDSLIIH